MINDINLSYKQDGLFVGGFAIVCLIDQESKKIL